MESVLEVKEQGMKGTQDSQLRAGGYVVPAGQGERLSVPGATVTIKAGNSAAGGAIEVFEILVPPHARPSEAHRHEHMTEAFYVLDGALAFTLNDQTFVAQRGSFVLVPAGTVHEYWNPTASPATVLDICMPGGAEAHSREATAARD